MTLAQSHGVSISEDRTVTKLTQGLSHSRDHMAGALKRAAHAVAPPAREAPSKYKARVCVDFSPGTHAEVGG